MSCSIRYFPILIYVLSVLNNLIDCEDNVTYSIKWPFDYESKNQFENNVNHQIKNSNPPTSLLDLYKIYKDNFIQIDDDPKYDRENQLNNQIETGQDTSQLNLTAMVDKSESELRPTIDPIVPITKRMLRRKDIRKEYPNYEFKRRKGLSNYNDETTRRSSNKVYNDDEEHSTYSDGGDEEEDDAYYEDDNYGKKSLGAHHTGWTHSSLAALPLNDHYYTGGSSGIPSYWNHGHYYPYYAQPYHAGHHHLGKYGKHLHREEYAIILVVISLAAFLGLIFSLLMPYAFIHSSALTGLPGNSVPYSNAVTTLNGNQFSNAAVSSDVNRIPINVFSTGRRRRKRMTRYYANRLLNRQLGVKDGNFESLINEITFKHVQPFDKLLNNIHLFNNLFNHQMLDFALQSTFNLLNNL